MRPLPVRAESRTIEIWGREVGPLAVAAAGGAAAGVAVVADRPRRVPRAEAPAAPRPLPAAREGRRQPQLPGRRSRPRPLARPVSPVIEERVHAPLALPAAALSRGRDGVLRSRGGVARAPHARPGAPRPDPELADPGRLRPHPRGVGRPGRGRASGRRGGHPPAEMSPAGEDELGIAIERIRFSLAVEEEMGEFYEAFKRDPLLGPDDPSQALGSAAAPALAVGGALLGDHRAADRGLARRRDPAADRAPVGAVLPAARRPAAEARLGAVPLRDVPSAAVIAGRAPAELASMDLSQGRSRGDGALRAGGRPRDGRDLDDPGRRPAPARRSPRSGPGRSSASASTGAATPTRCPPGDLAYVKLVGHLDGPRPPRHRRGGRGVLRALRALPRAGRNLRAGRLAQGDGSGPTAPVSPPSQAWPVSKLQRPSEAKISAIDPLL